MIDPRLLDYQDIIKNLVPHEDYKNNKNIYSIRALRTYLGGPAINDVEYIKEVVAILKDLGHITLRQHQIQGGMHLK